MFLMIRAIWNSWTDIPNTLPMGTNYFVSFILFWVGSLTFIWFPVHKIRHLFTVKAYFVPVAGIAYFIWAIVKAGGIGPIVHQPGKLEGSQLGWGVIKGIMSSIANFATLIGKPTTFVLFSSSGKRRLSPGFQLVIVIISKPESQFANLATSLSTL